MTAKPRYSAGQVDQAYEILKDATRAQPVSSEELGNRLALHDVEGNPVARGLVYAVMKTKRLPLVANSNGYFVASSYEDIRKYIDDLQRRTLGNVGRAALIDLLWREAHPDEEGSRTANLEEEWE